MNVYTWRTGNGPSGHAEYVGFETRASLLNIRQPGAWLRIPSFAAELAAYYERIEAIRRNPWHGITFRRVPTSHQGPGLLMTIR